MVIRVPPLTKYHNATTEKFKRTLAEAFPDDMSHAQPIKSFPAENRSGRWLISALLTSLAAALASFGGAEARKRE